MHQSKLPTFVSTFSSTTASASPPKLPSCAKLRVSQQSDANALAEVIFTSSRTTSDPSSNSVVAAVVQGQSFGCELTALTECSQLESWQIDGATVERGYIGQVYWAAVGPLLWLGLTLACDEQADITRVTESVYRQLLAVVAESDARHLLRCWNYVPRINSGMEQGDGDNEIYKRFCTGRLQAFEQAGLKGADFPAASAVGHNRPSLTVHILASSAPGQHLGNAKQVDAFAYPRQYGISSPSFARATLWAWEQQSLLFVSGTASIIGHKSYHQGDLDRQLATTVDNIQTLLSQSDKTAAGVQFVRVYLRFAEDREAAAKAVTSAYPNAEVVYLLADICRAELLVEIECVCA